MDSRALKGRDKVFAETVTGRPIRVAGGRLSRPFRACRGRWLFTQAVGLGWHVPAFQASLAINPATATCEMPILPRNPRQGRRVNQSLGQRPRNRGKRRASAEGAIQTHDFPQPAKHEEHHRYQIFPDEYRGLLAKHNIEYDERYVWDGIALQISDRLVESQPQR